MDINHNTELSNITLELSQSLEKVLAVKEAVQKDLNAMDAGFQEGAPGKALQNKIDELVRAEEHIQNAIDLLSND